MEKQLHPRSRDHGAQLHQKRLLAAVSPPGATSRASPSSPAGVSRGQSAEWPPFLSPSVRQGGGRETAAGSGFLGEEGEEAGKEQRARGGRTCRSLGRRARACDWTAYRPALVSIRTRLQIDSGVSFILLLESKQLPSPPALLSG